MSEIIVENRKTGCRYLLVGTGYGLALIRRRWFRWRFWFGITEETQLMACLCDREGQLAWCRTDELRVVSIDGREVSAFQGLSLFRDHDKLRVDQKLSEMKGSQEPSPKDFSHCAECGEALSGRTCPKCN